MPSLDRKPECRELSLREAIEAASVVGSGKDVTEGTSEPRRHFPENGRSDAEADSACIIPAERSSKQRAPRSSASDHEGFTRCRNENREVARHRRMPLVDRSLAAGPGDRQELAVPLERLAGGDRHESEWNSLESLQRIGDRVTADNRGAICKAVRRQYEDGDRTQADSAVLTAIFGPRPPFHSPSGGSLPQDRDSRKERMAIAQTSKSCRKGGGKAESIRRRLRFVKTANDGCDLPRQFQDRGVADIGPGDVESPAFEDEVDPQSQQGKPKQSVSQHDQRGRNRLHFDRNDTHSDEADEAQREHRDPHAGGPAHGPAFLADGFGEFVFEHGTVLLINGEGQRLIRRNSEDRKRSWEDSLMVRCLRQKPTQGFLGVMQPRLHGA